MNQRSKEWLLFTTFLLTACTRKIKSTETVIPQQTPLATPSMVIPPTEAPTPATSIRDVYYPDVQLTYRKVTIGGLECTIVPSDGAMWQAALALGDEHNMDDVDEIRLHPITNKGQEDMITFHPKKEPFPQPDTFRWQQIHAGSLACRSLIHLQP